MLLRTLILIDCVFNWMLLGSIHETLSSRAHRMRMKPQPYFFWLADFIDGLFFWQPEHCKQANEAYERSKAVLA